MDGYELASLVLKLTLVEVISPIFAFSRIVLVETGRETVRAAAAGFGRK